MLSKIKLYQADSYKKIKDLRRNHLKVNAIITDPPYDISKKNNFKTMRGRKGIDFGKWDHNFNLYSWIPQYAPLIIKGGAIVIFTAWENLSYMVNSMKDSHLVVKDLLRWIKNNPMPRNPKRRFITDFEFAVWGVKGGQKWTFNLPKNKSYLRPRFKAPVVMGKEKTGHPTQKSLKVMKAIIKILTNPGDLILDPFMGSGTTGIACQELNRNFIGIEINPKYMKMTQQRFEKLNHKE